MSLAFLSPQDSGIYVEKEVKMSEEPEEVDNFKKIVFSRPNRENEHMNSQRP